MSVDTKELRSFHGWAARTDSERLDMLRAAADCIESQAAEIDGLRDQLESHKAYLIIRRGQMLYCTSGMRDAYSDEKVRADAAEAEIERLRERLQGAANYIDTLGGNSKEYRAALSGEPK